MAILSIGTTTIRFLLTFVSVAVVCSPLQAASEAVRPNILVILADDLGYGDVQSLNPKRGKIETPRIDRLASEGMVFTDAHSSSSVCTPTRYSLLTGRYSWRTNLQSDVLRGYSPPLISSDRTTVAGLLKKHGYTTACIGKWHLGMDMPTTNESKPDEKDGNNVDWTGRIKNGPVDVGFDSFFGISASLDMPPYIYIENDRFVGECTTEKAFGRKGHAHKDFEAADVLPELGRHAVDYLGNQQHDKPFFLYVPLNSPHAPIVPTDKWKGRSAIGEYGDFVRQTDALVGQILDALSDNDLADNTLVIVTSDNGCSPTAGFRGLKSKGHYPSADFRGAKADLWEGGHRVPFVVRWPSHVERGSRCSTTISQLDFMATFADLLGTSLPEGMGEESVSFLPALFGETMASQRGVIHHSISGHFAYRLGKWKLLLARGSGGWSSPRENEVASSEPPAQLYDLEQDPSETTNLYKSHPEIAERLLERLIADIQRGRSTEGPPLHNDVEGIVLWKSGR